MDVGLAIITSVFGSASVWGLIQFLISRYDNKKQDLSQIKGQLDKIECKCDRNELAITRLQLFFLIKSQPSNEDAILMTAQRYFVELNGNAEAWAAFHKWAVAHKVDTGWYKALLKSGKEKK